MSDRVELRGLRVLGTHGALDFEQRAAQPFEVDLDIEADQHRASDSDDLADAINYATVVAKVVEIVENERFALLEALAGAIAEAVLSDTRVGSVTVAVRKLRPPVPADLQTAGVRITRLRAG